MSALDYPPLAEAVPGARAHARLVLAEWGFAGIAGDAETALSELLTNAIRESAAMSARPSVTVTLLADPGQLVIQVLDRAPGTPLLREPNWDEPGGRGLFTVAALAHRWDWTRYEDHKIVWCDFWV
ncbi:MAG: ATP-binding protein [Actinomycetota bacterium]|nr:ATP-binding protein [Actinomycetota bacterium]